MNKKRWWALAIFLVLLVIWISSAGRVEKTGLMSYINSVEDQPYTTQIYQEGTGKTLAMIRLNGTIIDNSGTSTGMDDGYDHQSFLGQLEDAFSQDNIKGVIIRVNSPGGGVYESDEIYKCLLDLKKTYHKPLVVYMEQEAASGGYYISMAADRIYANRNTLTGSIGVIMRTYNYQELANKIGIQDITFKSGTNKDLLNPMRPVSDAEKVIVQSLVHESYGFFVDAVAKGRNMDRSQVLKLADGRIYSGSQAKSLGLVDEVGYLDDAINGTAVLAHTKDPQIILYQNTGSPFLDWISSVKAPALNLLGLKQQMQQELKPELLYLA
ncbi:MAG: signal peptide peptidase SppA, partial [Methylocystaceae bacterium]